MTNISINILESDAEISRRILQALVGQTDTYFKKAFNKAKQQIVPIVSKAITSHPTYRSLISGRLKSEFGLDSPASRINELLGFWEKLTLNYIPPRIKGNEIIGSFSLSMIKSDYSDVLSSAAATVRTKKGAQLEWLRWLLLFGDKTIVKDYKIKFGPDSKSRSGDAIMVRGKGARWSVPSAFAGTISKNWITEAIDSVEGQVFKILEQSLRN